MKKRMVIVWTAVCMLLFAACGYQEPKQADVGTPEPGIIICDRTYYVQIMPVNELPEGYEYIGDLSEEAANNTGLEGHKMYAAADKECFADFYLYQECGTPVGENEIDTTQRQWAYLHWVLPEE